MSDKDLISVVMPAYNHEKFIGETIDSVLNQTWDNLELIIIDDGSTDKTADIVKAYDDKRLHYFYQDNQDAYNALNNGMKKAKGAYISIINSDDIYTLDRLERLVSLLKRSEAQCIFSDVAPVDGQSQPLDDPEFGWNQWHQKNRDFFMQMPGDLYRGFLHGNLMVTTSNLFMTERAYRRVGNFAELRYLHDYDYIFRLLRAYPEGVHYLEKEKLMYYRIHGGNTISEAAIIGREQDQDIIRHATLSQCKSDIRDRINTGIDRLISLDRELNDVRDEFANKATPANLEPTLAQTSTKELVSMLITRLRAKLFS